MARRTRGAFGTPDEFGNYWLSDDRKVGPAIFPVKRLVDGRVVLSGSWTELVDSDFGFIMDGSKRMQFKSVAEAYRVIERELQA